MEIAQPLATPRPVLVELLGKAGHPASKFDGLGSEDLVVMLSDRVVQNIMQGRKMKLTLEDLDDLLILEGFRTSGDAKAVLQGMVELRRRQVVGVEHCVGAAGQAPISRPERKICECFTPTVTKPPTDMAMNAASGSSTDGQPTSWGVVSEDRLAGGGRDEEPQQPDHRKLLKELQAQKHVAMSKLKHELAKFERVWHLYIHHEVAKAAAAENALRKPMSPSLPATSTKRKGPLVKSAFVRVTFSVHFVSSPGEDLVIVGSAAQLGEWNPARAIAMQWTAAHNWVAEVVFPRNLLPFEYKYMVKRASEQVWEFGKNHKMTIRTCFRDKAVQKDVWGCGDA